MAGYKKTVQDMLPAGFWTFDGERFDTGTRLLIDTPYVIYDESLVQNHGLLMVGMQEPNMAYRAGMASLVPMEPANQQAMGFGHYGRVNNVWPKAHVQILDNPAYNTAPQGGSFTLVMMFKKNTDETSYRNLETHNYVNIEKYIFNKPNAVTVKIIDNWSSEDTLAVSFPNGTITVNISKITGFYGNEHHLVARFDSKPQAGAGYAVTSTLIVNGETLGKIVSTYPDAPPNTATPQPMEIGGISASLAYHQDRATTPTYIDQVAYWNRALTDIEVWRLFKKVWQYQDMILKKNPQIFVPLQDDPYTNSNVLYTERVPSSVQAYHQGTTIRARPGPPDIPSSRAMALSKGLFHLKHTYNNVAAPITLNANDYSIEFWIKTGGTERAVILSMQGVEKPFAGPLLELNIGSQGQYQNGSLSFSENELGSVTTPVGQFFNTGNWQHIIIQRRAGQYLEIFVNGELKASKIVPRDTLNTYPSQLTMMGALPGKLYCDGEISYFALYNGKTFENYEAATRYQYSKIYRVRGVTTLRGVPYRATVRLYYYRTGELIEQKDSELPDGLFNFWLRDNSLVCSQILSMNDQNVRVRGFGPIAPAEIPDPPVT